MAKRIVACGSCQRLLSEGYEVTVLAPAGRDTCEMCGRTEYVDIVRVGRKPRKDDEK